MISLALDASTYIGTVAVFDDDRLLANGDAAMRGRDAERLMPLVIETLGRANTTIADVGQVICGSGPGSFTSLRIAASIAKGIAFGRGIPLLPVPSLPLIVAGNDAAPGRYLVVTDALRGELFVQPVEASGTGVRVLGEAELLSAQAAEALGVSLQASLVGPDVGKRWVPHARGAMVLRPTSPADLASWEPDYGRKAEAQSRWEAAQGRSLPA